MTVERDPRFKPNPGYCPAEAEGKRVVVELAHGGIGKCDDNATSPPGWPADGPGKCRWSIKGERHDIAFYYVL